MMSLPAVFRRSNGRTARRCLARAATACALVLPLLTGCYLPDRFQSEIRLTDTGEYGIFYKGDLVWLPLVRDMRMGKVAKADVPEHMAVLKRDLTRDSAFQSVTEVAPARFAVEYNRVGKLNWPDLVTFVRRNARIISMQTDAETGTVTVRASQAIKMLDPATINRIGLTSRGLLRVTTDAEVLDHNADSVKQGPGDYTIYDWNIDGIRGQEPFLKARLKAY